MSKYNATKLLPRGLQFIQGVIRGNTHFDITQASFGITQVSEQNIINNQGIPNRAGSIPIVAVDDSKTSEGVLGVELSFTQESTGITHDVTLWDVQIEGRQERDSRDYPIAYTTAIEPEKLTLSDPSFEFGLMVYVQVGDASDVTINVNPAGTVTYGEHKRDIQKIFDSLADGYVVADLKDKSGNQLYTHGRDKVLISRGTVDTDKTLTTYGKAADAQITGDKLRALDKDLTALDQETHKDFTTKKEAQDIKNGVLANADTGKHHAERLSALETKTTEIEHNSQTIRLLGHDWSTISSNSRGTLNAKRQYYPVDSTLTNASAIANAKAVGDAINQAYQTLNKPLNQVIASLNSLDKNAVISALINRLASAEARIEKLEKK